MALFDDGPGATNRLGAARRRFEGEITIKTRGRSSLSFEKKQYNVELTDGRGGKKDASLLGMPADSDWILHGPYADKSLMRNVLAYELWRRMGRWAPRSEYVSLYLNGDGSPVPGPEHYAGVYLLMERVERGQYRVPLSTMDPSDCEEPEITGGYLIELCHIHHYKDELFRTAAHPKAAFVYVYPRPKEITVHQADWIRTWFENLEKILAGPDFKDPEKGYAKHLDVDSFVDYILLNEYLRNIDAFQSSTFLSKERGGKLKAGPVWDFNFAMGNVTWGGDFWMTDGWSLPVASKVEWPARLMEDPAFEERFKLRWKELRRGTLAAKAVESFIEETRGLLHGEAERNFIRWPVLGKRLMGNRAPVASHAEAVEELKEWLKKRGAWMDAHIDDL